jgi:hypothetical protein
LHILVLVRIISIDNYIPLLLTPTAVDQFGLD